MVEARCPICGKVYDVPEGAGRAMVETRFLRHKDRCRVPEVGELVRVQSALAIVDGVDTTSGAYPRLTLHYPSGREVELGAAEVARIRDQDAARERFFG